MYENKCMILTEIQLTQWQGNQIFTKNSKITFTNSFLFLLKVRKVVCRLVLLSFFSEHPSTRTIGRSLVANLSRTELRGSLVASLSWTELRRPLLAILSWIEFPPSLSFWTGNPPSSVLVSLLSLLATSTLSAYQAKQT